MSQCRYDLRRVPNSAHPASARRMGVAIGPLDGLGVFLVLVTVVPRIVVPVAREIDLVQHRADLYRPRRHDGFDSESVLLSLDAGMYYGLDPVGTRIWELIGEYRSLQLVFEANGSDGAVGGLRTDAITRSTLSPRSNKGFKYLPAMTHPSLRTHRSLLGEPFHCSSGGPAPLSASASRCVNDVSSP
jgi:coenzyme PQQ synthesis protein D (PqqD)